MSVVAERETRERCACIREGCDRTELRARNRDRERESELHEGKDIERRKRVRAKFLKRTKEEKGNREERTQIA